MTELYKLKSGIEVPMPLSFFEIEELPSDQTLYHPDFSGGEFFGERSARSSLCLMNEATLLYLTEQEAVQATKAIIGEQL